ncbi:MAG: hypothetical protein ACRCUM_03140 [Mycoplasmoidaceae bacterium]
MRVLIEEASDPSLGGSREAQQAVIDSWVVGEEAPDEIKINNDLTSKFKIGDKIISFNEAVENITYYYVPELPETGEYIIGVELKINFKPEYASTQDIFSKTNSIGTAL